MADLSDNTCSSSASALESDEISLFLHQILLCSSSSSSSSSSSAPVQKFSSSLSPMDAGVCGTAALLENLRRPCRSQLLSTSGSLAGEGIAASEKSAGLNLSSGVGFTSSGTHCSGDVPSGSRNLSYSVGASDNDLDEYDCESEEGLDAPAGEIPAKTIPRNSTKRSRAAEVHNLSEKRRRSRINEKMKALQNLIPNSNKTDKASMLDEAIEYLKQLQLQVQMLSMRNGLTLDPLCLSGGLQPVQLSQMRMGFGDSNGSLNTNMTNTLPVNQETPMQTMFSLPNQCTTSNQQSVSNLSNIMNSGTSFMLESSMQSHLGPFQLYASSEDICRQDLLPHQQPNVDYPDTNSLESQLVATATVSLPLDAQASNLKDNDPLEACILRQEPSEGLLLKNMESNQILPHSNLQHALLK